MKMTQTQTDNRGAIQAPGINLERSMQRYLASAAYRSIPAPEGQMLFAVHAASNRGVAVHRGIFDRKALSKLMTEVTFMGLSGYTVLVDGLITYSSSNGHNSTEIRVDGQTDFDYIREEIVKAQMRDVRESKRQATNGVESRAGSPRPHG